MGIPNHSRAVVFNAGLASKSFGRERMNKPKLFLGRYFADRANQGTVSFDGHVDEFAGSHKMPGDCAARSLGPGHNPPHFRAALAEKLHPRPLVGRQAATETVHHDLANPLALSILLRAAVLLPVVSRRELRDAVARKITVIEPVELCRVAERGRTGGHRRADA